MRFPYSSIIGCLLLLGHFSLLSACSSKISPPPLPQGEQEIEGLVEKAPLSRLRRGTHLLSREGNILYYLESRSLNLSTLEGRESHLKGILEPNVSPQDVPVFVVQEGRSLIEQYRKIRLAHFGLSLEVPEYWEQIEESSTVYFYRRSTADPILTIFEDDSPLPQGIPMNIGGREAIRIFNESTGAQEVHFLHNNQHLILFFSGGASQEVEEDRREFLRLLQSLSLRGESTSSSKTPESTTIKGKPCGGVAGILCTKGEYCEIEVREQNIGRCVKQL